MSKGFTLIELLAVILILGIIALIAIPTVTNVINEAKSNANLDSANNYSNAVDEQIVTNSIKEENIIEDGLYTVGKLDQLGVNLKNDNRINNDSIVLIEDGHVIDYSLDIDGDIVNYDINKARAVLSEDNKIKDVLRGSIEVYRPGYIVYFNPISGLICDETAYNSNINKLGNTGCLKWNIINNDFTDKMDLILDHNTTKMVSWSSTTDISNHTNVINALYNDTKDWVGIEKINKVIDNFDYTNYYARLITANEVAYLAGNYNWDSKIDSSGSWFFLESKKQVAGEVTGKYGWLYDNTNDCIDYGCNKELTGTNGYWTSTTIIGYNQYVWQLGSWGDLNGEYVAKANERGVRPVITIKRNLLN